MLFCKDSDLFSLCETDDNKIMYFYEKHNYKKDGKGTKFLSHSS